MEVRGEKLWVGGCALEALAEEFGTPLYVYDEQIIRSQFRLLHGAFPDPRPDIHYAMKANSNPAILRILQEEGAWIDAVSAGEVRLARSAGFPAERILFTGNNTSVEEIEVCLKQGVNVNLGSLSVLERTASRNPGGKVSIRVNPGVGAGHHAHCITGGPDSKFGIWYEKLEEALELATRHNVRLIGVHSHIGTGIYTAEPMLEAMELLLRCASRLPDLEFIDFGGGFGIPYRPDQPTLHHEELGAEMQRRFQAFCKSYGRPLTMKIEPGRFLVAPAGTLLVRVTDLNETPQHCFVGVDSGFNHLVRPTMYGSYHHIVNASRPQAPEKAVTVVGNICESGDIFSRSPQGIDRPIPAPELGDCLGIRDAGAYGMSMSSQYNTRARPAEVLVRDGSARLIRRRETFEDLTATFCST